MEECNDVYFFTCDVYEIRADDTCNVFTFSDSRITWFSAETSVHWWSYYLSSAEEQTEAMTADSFSNGDCYAVKPEGDSYENGLVVNYTGGMCGFKYQVKNSNQSGFASSFKVMKDNATTLLAGSAMALAAVLSF